MPDGKPYILHLTPGTPRTGLWCNVCLLPSRVEVPIYVMGDAGPFVIATQKCCDGCGLGVSGGAA